MKSTAEGNPNLVRFSLNDQFEMTRLYVASTLKDARISTGLPESEVANWLNISERNYKKFEDSGDNGILPQTKYLPTLCQNLNISSDKLLGIEAFDNDNSYLSLDVKAMLLKYKKSHALKEFFSLCEEHSLDDVFFENINTLIRNLSK